MHSKFACGFLFGSGAEGIETFDDPNVLKTQFRQHCEHLCLRQSTGDSTRPQVDVSASVLADFHVHSDIRQLQAAAGAKDAKNL